MEKVNRSKPRSTLHGIYKPSRLSYPTSYVQVLSNQVQYTKEEQATSFHHLLLSFCLSIQIQILNSTFLSLFTCRILYYKPLYRLRFCETSR
ncbi:hypothetical protein FGO68_gene13338 [Halteria grandinella]|uniref:Uncharacterized protein n=1 Tax=Halteria grandinella TaxID=5974 RepID=A0A8J8TB43_HALGN|nr:hypothetical protein FGO68_gene13338 [Halteria grandinella]